MGYRASLVLLWLTLPATAETLAPRLVLHLDTSGAMRWDSCGSGAPDEVDDTSECPGADVLCSACNTAGCGDLLANDSRLFKIRRAAKSLIESFGDATFLLSRFHQAPAPFACNGGGWTGAPPGCGVDPAGSGDNRADVLVQFLDDNHDALLAWLDGCDNWPLSGDCDAATGLAPDTGCALCADCGSGCDREIRGHGDAPIAGSLAYLQDHLTNLVMPADLWAGCRPYGVMLLSAGENTCAGDPVAQAAALCDGGIATLVVGIGAAGFGAELAAIAAAGCGPSCVASPQGVARCDGQVIPVDDDAALSLAVARFVESGVLIERCNGQDDDCDGLSDEDFPALGSPCCDPCPGAIVCDAAQTGSICSGVGPCPEICDLLDNDCDGQVDEVPPPQICEWLEVCNSIDDDGDGLTDEPPLPGLGDPCGSDIGECEIGNTCCAQGGTFACCNTVGPEIEACDCLDNDCNTLTDDEVVRRCYAGDPAECPDPQSGTCLGLCWPGTQPCDTSSCPRAGWGACVGEVGPRPEECNCLDDDCDGLIDDGATCTNGTPCVACTCHTCDPEDEYPCPQGYICSGDCGEPPPYFCMPSPCWWVDCEEGFACDDCTGECVSLCERTDCGESECCGEACCEPWESCDWRLGGICVGRTCSNPEFPCPPGQNCVERVCVDPDAGPPLPADALPSPGSVAVGGGGGCACAVGAGPAAARWPWLALGAFALARRRRCRGPSDSAMLHYRRDRPACTRRVLRPVRTGSFSMTESPGHPQLPGVSGRPAVEVSAPVCRETVRPTFDEVYEAEFSFVCNSLRRLGASAHDVADLAQEVFVVLLRRLSDYDPARPVRPWLFGIALRVLVDDRRLARRKHEVVGVMHDWNDPRTARDGAPAADARDLVLDAMRALDVEQRAVLTLHDIEEFSMPEIAHALSIPVNTGYSRLRLARERLGREVRRLRAKGNEVHP